MNYSFNLIDNPWIPCYSPNGTVQELSLRDALNHAPEFCGIAGDSALETAAIYRLLLSVIHSALRGPRGSREWNDLWRAGTWDAPWLNDYLSHWIHRFDLFDPARPFFQADDVRVKPKSLISLAMDAASGNNAALFDHHTELTGMEVPASKAARILIVAQLFGLCGLSGLEQKFTDAPWGRGIIFLVEGENCFQTLALNCLRYGGDYPSDVPTTGEDLPAWEADDPYLAREIPFGYLDYLTWQNRRIRLIPEGDPSSPMVSQVTIAPGLRLAASQLDPFKNYRKDDHFGFLATRFLEDRVLWRDSSALMKIKDHGGNHPPANFEWVAIQSDHDHIELHRTLSYMALGMANDQAKVEFFREEHMPLPLVFLESSELVGRLETALSLVEEARKGLRSAVMWMAALLIAPNDSSKKWNEINRITKEQAAQLYNYWTVEHGFWGTLEIPFSHLLTGLPIEPDSAMAAWKSILKDMSWKALERAADQAGNSVQSLKAAVRARSILGYQLKQLLNEAEKEVIV
jgi:CRISPR system Cascade subunit CasA